MSATGTCTYLAAKDLNLWFNGASFTFPGTIYLAADTGTSGASGLAFEVSSGNGYARLSVTCNTTNFPTISSTNVMNNGVTFSFATATGAWTGNGGANTTCKGIVIMDASSGGNALFFGSNSVAETVVNNNVLQYTANNFTITFN